jgi:hypothetical protein
VHNAGYICWQPIAWGRHFLVVTDPLYGANYSMKEADNFQPGKKSYFSSWSKKFTFHCR